MNIVIASILKPLDDVRHFHKLGLSLAKIPNVQIHILGREVDYQFDKQNLLFHSIYPTKNGYISRLLAPWKMFQYLVKVKPNVIVSCTYELLIVIILYKILFGTKIVYDVQENYTKNIHCNLGFGTIKKRLIFLYIQVIERLAQPFINQFWLAESCYKQELPFVRNKSIVLENKSLFFKSKSSISLKNNQTIRLLYSGTIAIENGIFEAIQLASALHKLDNRYELTIVGCCHQPETLNRLKQLLLSKNHFIHLIYNTIPLEYSIIQENVLKADIGLICYRNQENFKNKMPTKLYEYTTAGLPILLATNSLWESFCKDYNNCLNIDYQNINAKYIHDRILNKIFYQNGNELAKKLTWENEETKLINSAIAILKNP